MAMHVISYNSFFDIKKRHIIKPGMETEMERNEMKQNRNCVWTTADF